MTVALARHGETAFNKDLRFQGRLPVPLNDRGREQARELAEVASEREWSALYCSPLERARETAGIVGARLGLEPVPDERFVETDTGEWTNLLHDEVKERDPDGYAHYLRAGADFRFPGGESLVEQMERVAAGLEAVRSAGRLPALVVCHRGVIRVALCHAHPDGLDRFMDIEVPNGSLVDL